MKFIIIGREGTHSSHTPFTPEELYQLSRNFLEYKKIYRPFVKQPIQIDTDKRPTLENTWWYFIFDNGTQIYEFSHEIYFFIEDVEVEPREEQLKDIIRLSHKRFKDAFEERRKEHSIFNPVSEIYEDTIRHNVLLLKEVLHSQLK